MTPRLRRIINLLGNDAIVHSDEYYSKNHAVNVAMAFKIETQERRKVIDEMSDGWFVPSLKAVHGYIILHEAGLPVIKEEWHATQERQRFDPITS